MRRRDFVKTGALAATAAALGERSALGQPKPSNAAKLAQRPYGKTGVKLSIIGLGGLMLRGREQDQVNRLVAEAIERGINYFDVAPQYGNAEILLGPALEPYRKNVFLACKTAQWTREGAKKELERSLKRLRTDRFDLYQLHCLRDVKKDVDVVFSKGGAMEVLAAEKKAGRVRFLGFSAHTEEAALAALDRFAFDSILFPVNYTSYLGSNFGPRVITKAQARGTAILAIKALARQRWPRRDPLRKKFRRLWYQPVADRAEADLALRFTLSQPVTAAVPPADDTMHRIAYDLAPAFKPITDAETEKLRALAKTLKPLFPGV